MEGRASHATTGSTMSYGSIQLSYSATGETIGQVRGVVADFGARAANLRDLPAVHSRPAMAESDIVNSEVRGAVVVIQRGAVPLVDKARRAQMAGAAAALIVNTDERPLLAHGLLTTPCLLIVDPRQERKEGCREEEEAEEWRCGEGQE